MFRTLFFSLISVAAASGCVTVYQPVTALQRPVVVDPALPNFEGQRMLLRCVPGDGADQGESEDLCNNLSTLYSNQGAKVEIEIPDETGKGLTVRGDESERSGEPPNLIIELKARKVHGENSPLLWALCIASATLIPSITEATFAQDVMIRDAEGFLLISDTLQARFIRYFGFGFWAVNGLLDLIVRPKGEGLIGTNHQRDFSRDFHGQMSQLAFHARMRAKILKSFEPDAPIEAAKPVGPKGKGAPPQPPLSPLPFPTSPPPPPPPPPPPVKK